MWQDINVGHHGSHHSGTDKPGLTLGGHLGDGHLHLVGHETDDSENNKATQDAGQHVPRGYYHCVSEEEKCVFQDITTKLHLH